MLSHLSSRQTYYHHHTCVCGRVGCTHVTELVWRSEDKALELVPSSLLGVQRSGSVKLACSAIAFTHGAILLIWCIGIFFFFKKKSFLFSTSIFLFSNIWAMETPRVLLECLVTMSLEQIGKRNFFSLLEGEIKEWIQTWTVVRHCFPLFWACSESSCEPRES